MVDRALGHASLIGLELGHYRIVEKIGEGGMGIVYRAHDQHLDREAAIKVLSPGTLADEHSRKRFHKEALALSKLNHPNVATIYDFDTQEGLDFLVMEYIPGMTLSEKLAKRPLPEKEVVAFGTQLAEGLAAAHEHGVVHRDLKPGNLRVTSDGRVKILDFGLAKLRLPVTASAVTESFSETQGMAGTPPYMAPEQLRGEEIDARTDIHAVGIVLYEMATGQRPFAEVERLQLIEAILRRQPPPPTVLNPNLSPELGRIIGKCLEKEPENRYQSAKEVVIDLQRLKRDSDLPLTTKARAGDFTARHGTSRWRRASLVGAAILTLAAFAVYLRHQQGQTIIPREATTSIAVLPFIDLSPGHDQEYFSDGLAEELLNDLTKIPSLKVAARTSAFQFKGKNEDLRVIGQKLNVANVLEGSLRKEGSRVRVTAQLIKADDGFHLWSETYDRDLKDAIAVQDEIARAVSAALKLQLLGVSSNTTPASRTANPEAYQAFLQARYFAHMQDEESARKALDYANSALQSDPKYAAAYALRANIELAAGGMTWTDLREGAERARRDTEKAIALDPNLADGYRVLSMIQSWFELNCPKAENPLKTALQLAPRDPDNLAQGALLAMCQGHLEKAVGFWKEGLLLDPLRPDEYLWLSQSLRDLGRFEEAHAALRSALNLNPTEISMIHEVGGEVYLAQGRPQEALAEMEKEPPGVYHDLGEALAYQALGKRQESNTAFARMLAQHPKDAAYQIAQVYAYRGETDQAFEWLDRALRQHDPGLMWLKTDLKLTSLRNDPRYADLLTRLNLSN